MIKKSRDPASPQRRRFLRNAGAVGVAALVPPTAAATEAAPQTPAQAAGPAGAGAAGTASAPETAVATGHDRNGADFMVDVFKSIGFEYSPFTPSNDFRALHESLINYGGNRSPELLTCLHEEAAVAMAHGYYKVEGRPLLVMVKEDVGLMHAFMAVNNAFGDRVPVFLVTGALPTTARPSIVQKFTKWEDSPRTLGEFAQAATRAYAIALTPPAGPVLLMVDAALQERGIAHDLKIPIPAVTLPAPAPADAGAIAEVARLLAAANNPVIIADKLRTGEAMGPLVEVAEALQAIVIARDGHRTNFPSYHPLHRRAASLQDADVVLGLEFANLASIVPDGTRGRAKPTTISITVQNPYSQNHVDMQARYSDVDVVVPADAAATLPPLVEAVKRLMTADRRTASAARGARFATEKAAALNQARVTATYAWDLSPISMPRLSAELWDQLRHEDWAMVGWGHIRAYMDTTFWNFDKPYRSNGSLGGGGLGYGAPASVGAALAHRKHGRLPVNIQNDGDFMFCPSVLWTAAKYRIPLLTVMRNNRAYHQEIMEVQYMCNQMNRGFDRARIGNDLGTPHIDFGSLAKSLGVYGEGPIENPKDLAPAIKRAIAMVKRGEPALLDVIVQPR